MWEVKISYCWGVIKILLMWRTTLLLADCTWGDLCQEGGKFSVQECLQKWRKIFFFSIRWLKTFTSLCFLRWRWCRGLFLSTSSPFNMYICYFHSLLCFQPRSILNICSNLSSPSFIVNTGLRVLLRGLNENVEAVQPRHNGDKRLVVERLLLGQVFRAPVAEVLAALDVSSTYRCLSILVEQCKMMMMMMYIISSIRVPTWKGQSLNPFCRWPFHLLNCWHLASPAILRTGSIKENHSKNTCEVDVGGLEDILEESPEEDAVLVQHLFGTFHTVAHVRMVLLTFVPVTDIR